MADDPRLDPATDTTGGSEAGPAFDVVIEDGSSAGGEEGGAESRHDRLARRTDQARERDAAAAPDTIGPQLHQLVNRLGQVEKALQQRDVTDKERDEARRRSEAITEAERELVDARQAYRDALDSGDSDAAADAQIRVSRAIGKADRLKEEAEQSKRRAEGARPAQPQPQPNNAKAQFMQRYAGYMQPGSQSRAAIARIDEELKAKYPEGVSYGSAAYWAELEGRVSAEVVRPSAGAPAQGGDQRRPAQPAVAGGQNGNRANVSGSGAREAQTVRLSREQADFARRKGIPLHKYAEHVHRAQQRSEI